MLPDILMCPCVSVLPLQYILCGFPEVSRVRESAVELGQFLQHVGQLRECGSLAQVVRPAGWQDLLRAWVTQEKGVDWHLWILKIHKAENTLLGTIFLVISSFFQYCLTLKECSFLIRDMMYVHGECTNFCTCKLPFDVQAISIMPS